jgi:hypothetical protein
MIQNLPDKIDALVLENFNLGSGEAVKDSLLWDCYCDTPPIRSFLQDRRSLLVGAKGAGKTAVFTLLRSQKITFDETKKDSTIIIGIDEPIEYATAVSILTSYLKSKVNDPATQFRFLWEVYILYRICLALKGRQDLQQIQQKVNTLCSIFSSERPKLTLLQVLTAAKKTVGFKVNMSNPAFPSPDFYVSTEPSSNATAKPEDPIVVDLEAYKREINVALVEAGLRVYVLIDNLDDFVAKDDYRTQKHILHGILNCTRSYGRFPSLRIKVSLRADLFRKLDFSQMGGYDKIEPDTVELVWSDADIRLFVARRIAINLMTALRLKGLKLAFEERSLYLPPPERTLSFIDRLVWRFFRSIKRRIKHDSSDARVVTAWDQISREMITTVFPKEVVHRTDNGGRERCEIFTYLASHFDLGDEHPTPRLILTFLQCLTDIALEYYRQNPDERQLKRNAENEYALFKRDHFATAYNRLQKGMRETIKSCMTVHDWQKLTEIFFSRKGKKTTFSFNALRNMVGLEEAPEEAKAYIAYLAHLGVLRCKDPQVAAENRSYELPIVLQHIWNGNN